MTTSPAGQAAEAPPPPSGPPPSGPPPRRRSLRTQLSLTLALAVGLPLLVAAVVGVRLLAAREELGSVRGLTTISASAAVQVEAYLAAHVSAVRSLALAVESTGHLETATAQPLVAGFHALYPGFITMLAADQAGLMLAGHPMNETERWQLRVSPRPLDDRPYFRHAMETGQPYVSEVFEGRGFGSDPIVAISAPVTIGGRRVGIVEGSLDLRGFPLSGEVATVSPVDVIVLDPADRVAFATPGSGQRPLDAVAGGPLGLALQGAAQGVAEYLERGVPSRIAVTTTGRGWHVVARQRVADVRRATDRFVLTMTVTLAAGLVAALALAVVLAGRLTRPLTRLQAAVGAFLDGARPEPLPVGRQAPREVAELVAGYEEMQRRLGHSLSGLLPICAWCKRIKDEQQHWQPIDRYLQERAETQFTHGLCGECAERLAEARPTPPPGQG
ncbi:MAG: hypothetical protein IPQ24_05500 [Anaeromyxobacter sp.]|nr:hypothetical protein [Anaeromyxobacter sp.]